MTSTTSTTICRKCGVTLKAEEIASTSLEGKHTGFCCIGNTMGVANQVTTPADALAKTVEKNSKRPTTTAPKVTMTTQEAYETIKATEAAKKAAKSAPVATTTPSAPAVVAPTKVRVPAPVVANAAKQTEFDRCIALLIEGKKVAEIATAMGLTYGRVKVLVWFHEFVGAAPGCTGYTAEKRAEGQKRYEAGVAARKAAKVSAPAALAAK